MTDINSKISKGMLGTKLGMTQVWDESNKLIPVTVIELAPNVVTQVRTPEKDGYNAVQIAYGQIDPRKVNKPLAGSLRGSRRHAASPHHRDPHRGHFRLHPGPGAHGRRHLRCRPARRRRRHEQGQGLRRCHEASQLQGRLASHGSHRNHRKPGSIGASSTPSRVFKGMRMAGRMGGERVTVLNLTVHAVDIEKGLLLVKGAVPGARGRIVYVRNAVKGA
jgi:large subunit ribosomal protein L3